MEWLQQLDVGKFLLFILVLSRVSGLLMTAPLYAAADLPMQVRALFTLAVAALVFPSQWQVSAPDPGNLAQYVVLVGGEVVIGAALGMGVAILFLGINLAGQLVGQVSGLSIAEVFDPTHDNNTSIISRLLFLVTLSIFLAIGGHRIVMAGLLDTFHTIPPGSAVMPASLADTLITLVSQSFALGIRAAAPVVASMLLANLALGLIARAVPQLNILVIGFGMNALLALGVLGISLGAAVWVFEDQVEPAITAVLAGLKSAGYSVGSTQ